MLSHAEPIITSTATKVFSSPKDPVVISVLSLEEQFSDTIFTDFEGSPPMFGGSEWDENDTSHEDLRRPPLRKNPDTKSTLSARDQVEMREIQLHKDETVRQALLESQMSKDQAKAKLDEEFGERRRQLQRDLNALHG